MISSLSLRLLQPGRLVRGPERQFKRFRADDDGEFLARQVFPSALHNEVWKFVILGRNKNRLPRCHYISAFRRGLRWKDKVGIAGRAVGIDLAVNHIKITVAPPRRLDAEAKAFSF